MLLFDYLTLLDKECKITIIDRGWGEILETNSPFYAISHYSLDELKNIYVVDIEEKSSTEVILTIEKY